MTAAMILCAGFGTRLRPLTDHFPKPLLPIGDRPAFQHILLILQTNRMNPIVLNAHHGADALMKEVPKTATVLFEPSILGTAGGVHNAAKALGPGDALVWNGDILMEPDMASLLEQHQQRQAMMTLLVAPRPHGQGTLGLNHLGGVARLRGEVFSKETMGGDYLGLMLLSQRAREKLPTRGCLIGDLVMPWLRNGGHIHVVVHHGRWIDIGTPERYWQANMQWLEDKGEVAWCAPDSFVSTQTELEHSVVASGARVLGQGKVQRCVVLPGAELHAPAKDVLALPDGTTIRLG